MVLSISDNSYPTLHLNLLTTSFILIYSNQKPLSSIIFFIIIYSFQLITYHVRNIPKFI